MTKLGEYLKSLEGKYREACIHDCATLPADWIVSLGLGDPMRDMRWQYTTEEQALNIVQSNGGLVATFDDVLNDLGIYKTNEPKAGDIGVISIRGYEAGSIFTGERWAFVGGRGIAIATISNEFILACWGVGYNG